MNTGRLNVLMFTNTTCRAGVEEHVLTLLRGLDREQFRLYLVCPPVLVELYGRDIPEDVTVVPLLLEKPTQFMTMWHLGKVLRRYRIDVLHAHLFYSSLFAAPVGWISRVPLIVETTHVRESWRRGLKASYFVDRIVARFVDRFIAVSEANAEYLIEDKRVPARKVVVIRNGVNLARFDPCRQRSLDLKRNLGFDVDDPVLLVGARLEPQKGHSVLLDAMTTVVGQFPRARLVCVGDGSCRQALETQTDQLGLRKNVRFVGYQAQMPDWLALANIVVLPSLYEGLPLIAIEALAAGRPMVATAVDGTGEVVVDEVTGLTVPAADPSALAQAIIRLLGNPSFWLACARAGRSWVEERFDQRDQIRLTEGVYSTFTRAVALKQSSELSPSSLS
jgi:glycosyltransferase involved in cell wall biosynthesis